MDTLTVLALVLFAGSCYGADTRVIGGTPATIEEYPFLVQVDFLNAWSNVWSQNCAGSVLNELYVLSAAHCFEGSNYQPSHRRIRAGSTYRNSGGVLVYISWDEKHPSYGVASRWDADITVVRLSSFLTLTPVIQQATIAAQGSAIADLMPLAFAGWGHTEEGGQPSSSLEHVTLYTINRAVCAEAYEQLQAPVTANMICAGAPGAGGRDHCQGDAGGPLLYGPIVVAVAAWGQGCGDAAFPGVSTAVGSFSNWIVSVVA